MTTLGKALLATAAIFAGSAATTPRAAFNAPGDVAAIRKIETVLATETDIDKLIGYYAPDATVLDIYAPGLYRGRDQIRAAFAPQLAGVRTMSHDMAELNIASDGRFACAAMQIRFTGTLKNGAPLALSVRQLDAFKKIDGRWRIVQQHISLPTDAATAMAIPDGPIKPRGAIVWARNPLPGPASMPAEAKAAIRKWMDVGGASTGLDMLMGYYGPGDDILVYDSAPSNLRGLGEVRAHYAAIMNSYTGITLEMPEFVVDSDGLFGVQLDTQRLTLTMKDGSTRKLALRQSDCMRKSGDRWYSFLEHLSFAIDPATNKAITGF